LNKIDPSTKEEVEEVKGHGDAKDHGIVKKEEAKEHAA